MSRSRVSGHGFFSRTVWILLLLTVAAPCWLQADEAPSPDPVATAAAASVSLYDEPISFEERVRHQRAIEQVYWRHRIWPDENLTPKPDLQDVLPAARIRERVTAYLQKSAALEIFWRRPLTGAQLQAEIERMGRDTRQPELLRELFAALGNDPDVIAECLARPEIADRLTRRWYARDSRFHGKLRERAETALTARTSIEDLTKDGGEYAEIEWRRTDDDTRPAGLDTDTGSHVVIDLTETEWSERIVQLADRFRDGLRLEDVSHPLELLDGLAVGTLSPLVERDDRFAISTVLAKGDDRLRVATVSWRKRPFAEWWAAEGRASLGSNVSVAPALPPYGGYRLQWPGEGGCEIDSWVDLGEAPGRRYQHTIVWTGTEAIVWGGNGGGGYTWLNTGGRYYPATDSWRPISTGTGVPAARRSHAAVWTGHEMIVWGGEGSDHEDLNTGGRYDPLTDTWSPTSTGPGVPGGGSSPTMVWTGNEAIAWGGVAGLNTGGRYDPSTDTWTPTSTVDAPVGRFLHTAVWTGSEMIVWGGFSQIYHRTGGRYDPSTDRWNATPVGLGEPQSRANHSAVWTGTEMIIWGGGTSSTSYGDGARYNPVTNAWATISNGAGSPEPRKSHAAVWTGTEMIVWGGGALSASFGDGARYDLVTNSWTPMSPTTLPARSTPEAIWTGTEMVIWGGWSGVASLPQGGRYAPATDSWLPVSRESSTLSGRSGSAVAWTGAEMIVWGGYDSDGSSEGGGLYNAATNGWTPISAMPGAAPGAAGQAYVWTGTELIVWGGERYDGGFVYLNTGGRYSPAVNAWSTTSTTPGVPTGRRYPAAVWTGSEMIVWGGYDGNYMNTGGRYDPATDSWAPTSTGDGVPSAREFHSGVWTGSEMIVWGGSSGATNHGTGGRYDPATDSWSSTSTASGAPSPRRLHSATWTGSEMIVWGGRGSEFQNSGARYDPATDAWTPTSQGNGVPAARQFHSAVWTGTEMIVWGGSHYDGAWLFRSDGGRYDPAGDSWTGIPPSLSAPTERQDHVAVWNGNEMIVWGGYDGTDHLGEIGFYCACGDASVDSWYPDLDGDGFGAGTTGIYSCSQPPGYLAQAGDCDDTNPDTHAGAPEVNDGLDNQCPGDAGHGLIDEISGGGGFANPADPNELSWPAQTGATGYEIARSGDPRFVAGCDLFVSATSSWVDTDPVPPDMSFHYLVRAAQPNAGSWGADSAGVERTPVCP